MKLFVFFLGGGGAWKWEYFFGQPKKWAEVPILDASEDRLEPPEMKKNISKIHFTKPEQKWDPTGVEFLSSNSTGA